jgi:hypothetical protein
VAKATCSITVSDQGIDGTDQFAGKTYTKDFIIAKQIKGDPTTSYWLVPNTASIIKDAEGNLTPQDLTFNIIKQSGSRASESVIATNENLTLRIFKDSSEITAELTDTTYSIDSSNTDKQVRIELYNGDILIDRESIGVVKDGTDAESPYTINIFNDKVTALSNTTELVNYD